MEPVTLESEGIALVRERPRRVLGWIAAVLGILAIRSNLLALYVIAGAAVDLLRSYFGPPRVPGRGADRPGTVTADASGVHVASVGRDRHIARGKLVNGWLDSFGGLHRVALQLRGADILWIRVRHPDEARALLHALGLAPDQRVFASRLVSPLEEKIPAGARQGILALLMIVGLWGVLPALMLARFSTLLPGGAGSSWIVIGLGGAFVAGILGLVAQALLPRTALVGTDGVVVKGMGSKRFIPWSQVLQVRADERGVWLDRAPQAGGPTLLATVARSKVHLRLPSGPVLAATTLVLRDRIDEARAAGSGASASGARFAVLDRRGRSLDVWQRELRGLLMGSVTGYRDAPVEAEELARVVEDGGAPVERRIAAAVVLGGTQEPALRQRIRVVVDACADRDLRAAIERAAEGEIDEGELDRAARARV